MLTNASLLTLDKFRELESLGLDSLGIEFGRNGTIPVDGNYKTPIDNIYAVGDVIGPPSLASVSMEQGRRAICHALETDPGSKFELVPIGIYALVWFNIVAKSRRMRAQQPTRWRAYRAELIGLLIVAPLAIGYFQWEQHIGMPREMAGASVFFFLGLGMFMIAVNDPSTM